MNKVQKATGAKSVVKSLAKPAAKSRKSVPEPGKIAAMADQHVADVASSGTEIQTFVELAVPVSVQPAATVSRDQVFAIYMALLGREPESEEAINYHMTKHLNLAEFTEFVISTPASTDYLMRRLGPESVEEIVAKGALLGDYAFFFFLMNRYFPVWHSSNLIVLAVFQFINQCQRSELVERFILASRENNVALLLLSTTNILKPARFRAPVCVLERYQDVRVSGVTYASGVRGCEERYQFIRSVACQFQRQFSVLDLGANLGYFAVRLVEEFDCIVVCCEGTYANWLRAIVSKSAKNRIVVLSKTMTIDDLERMAECESFDLVLAMSVVHHVGAPVSRTIAALRNMAWKLIVELPTEQTACGPDRVKEALIYDWAADGGQLIGHSFSHLPGEARPTILFDGWAEVHERAYMFSPRPCGVKIQRDWQQASVVKNGAPQPYLPALNLHSYLCFNGIWPVPVEAWSADLANLGGHGDIMPWNFLIHAGGLQAIDFHTDQELFFNPDGLGRGLVEDIIRWASYTPDVPADTEITLTPPGQDTEIVSHGFMQVGGGVVRPAHSNAMLVLHHDFEPGRGLTVALSIRPSPDMAIAVYGNDYVCDLSRDTSNEAYERLTFHVSAEASLRNYPLILRFEMVPASVTAADMPDFYSLHYHMDEQ